MGLYVCVLVSGCVRSLEQLVKVELMYGRRGGMGNVGGLDFMRRGMGLERSKGCDAVR